MLRAPRALGVITAALLAGSLLGAPALAADPDPNAGNPGAGACYDLTLKQAYESSSPEAPVSCGGRHTMVVTAIGELPASVDWATVDWDDLPDALGREIDATCAPAAAKVLGPHPRRAKSLYRVYWFAPTEAEVEAGARWFSCLVAPTTSAKLLPIPDGHPRKLKAKIPNGLARCAKKVKGGFATVACSSPHGWRTTYTRAVSGKATDKNALKAARRFCPKHTRSDDWLYTTDYINAKVFVLGCSDKTKR